jgi:hypothetical protein
MKLKKLGKTSLIHDVPSLFQSHSQALKSCNVKSLSLKTLQYHSYCYGLGLNQKVCGVKYPLYPSQNFKNTKSH